MGAKSQSARALGNDNAQYIGSMTMDFELIEKYAIFVSLCDSLQIMELVRNDQRYIRTKMVTSPKMMKEQKFELKRKDTLTSRSNSARGRSNSLKKK